VTELQRGVRAEVDPGAMETTVRVLAWGGLVVGAAVCAALFFAAVFGS
jgi:hypothetical protein